MRSDGQRNFVLCDSYDGEVGNLFFFSGDSGQGSGENIFAIVVAGRLIAGRTRLRYPRKCELCVPPGELTVAEARVQGDLVSGALGNVQPVVNGVGSAWRNQV